MKSAHHASSGFCAVCALVAMLAAAATPAPAWAQGQTVWRCGPDGRSYADTPCAEGRPIGTPAARPAADIEDAQARAAREKQAAQALAREQARQLAAERRSGWIGLSGFEHTRPATARAPIKPAAKPPSKQDRAQRQPTADADTWRATVPGSRQTKG